jgi:hypothetical protein
MAIGGRQGSRVAGIRSRHLVGAVQGGEEEEYPGRKSTVVRTAVVSYLVPVSGGRAPLETIFSRPVRPHGTLSGDSHSQKRRQTGGMRHGPHRSRSWKGIGRPLPGTWHHGKLNKRGVPMKSLRSLCLAAFVLTLGTGAASAQTTLDASHHGGTERRPRGLHHRLDDEGIL